MNPVLLRGLAPFIVGFFWMLSVFLFLRGHNQPGGGFIGALCFALGLLAFSFAVENPARVFQRALPIIRWAIIVGLACFVVSFSLPLIVQKEALQALWTNIQVPVAGKFSTVLIFDLGVYLIVISSLIMIFSRVFGDDQ